MSERTIELLYACRNLCLIPQTAVLFLERGKVTAGVEACLSSGMVKKHQCKKAPCFWFLGEQLRESLAQADRVGSKLGPHEGLADGGCVAFVEDEINHREYRVESFSQEMAGRHLIWDARLGDLVLGPHQPLGKRGLRHQERPSDLLGRQPAQCTQRKCDARLEAERGVTAGKDEAQPVVRINVGGIGIFLVVLD